MNIVQEVSITIKKILLVDDEVSVREVVELCLKDLGGWNVVAAGSALDGLQIATTEHTDAIILDLSQPGTSILKFMGELRNNPKTQAIPVVMLSAKAKWLDSQTLRHYQIAGVIPKPFDPVILPKQISKILGWN